MNLFLSFTLHSDFQAHGQWMHMRNNIESCNFRVARSEDPPSVIPNTNTSAGRKAAGPEAYLASKL